MADNDLHEVAYAWLDESQLAALARCSDTQLKRYGDKEKLFECGQRDFNFYVVKSGKVAIVEDSSGAPKTIRIHGPGEFTGDASQLTGRLAVVSAIAQGACEVYEISPAALRKLLNQCVELSDIILRAFIARRRLVREPPRLTRLIDNGTRYSRDPFRIREYPATNREQFTWLDLESDPHVGELLKPGGQPEAKNLWQRRSESWKISKESKLRFW
jgi:thioredoxin reductase (NADPH)